MQNPSQPNQALAWLAKLRILVGLVFLTSWFSNLFQGFYTAEGLLRFFTELYPQSENPLALYAAFIQGVILPIRGVFAPFQLIAEGIMAIALVVGLFTPFFSLAGIFFLANTFLATLGQDWPWAYLMPIGILVATFFTQAGRALGIDAYLLKRFGERGKFLW
jgi:uncharacterized membrane protein YphA (DoxX/SURF4 family)